MFIGYARGCSKVKIVASLLQRSISCSMGLNATQDRKTNPAQANRLLAQLKETEGNNIYVCVWYKNAQQSQQVSLTVFLESPHVVGCD